MLRSYILIIPYFVGVCQEGFKLLSTSRRFGVIRGALLVLFGSPLDILIIPHVAGFVKGQFHFF